MRVGRLAIVLLAAGCRRPGTEEPAPAAAATASASARAPVSASPARREAPEDAAVPRVLPDVAAASCLAGFRGLDEATCYLVPDGPPPARLLVYLPGIVPPTPASPQKEKVQRIVAASARRAHVVALLPRGRRGIGPTDAKDWWAWPTTSAHYDAYAGAMVAEWIAARARLEDLLGRSFARTYVAGSSSGAYFLTALAFRGALDADGWAATSGGGPGLGASRRDAGARRAPFYVGYATGDPTNGAPRALGVELAAAGWPSRVAVHPGGHGASEVYLDEALAWFEEDGGAR